MTIQIYVGTYGKYNSGSIAGKWLDLEDYADSEEFYKACKELHKNESDPEFMFQDYEGFPSGLYCESGNIEEIYAFIDLDVWDREIVETYLEYETGSTEDYSSIIESYAGRYNSLEDYALEHCDSCGLLENSWIENFIDFEQMGRELAQDMTTVEKDGEIWFFTNQ